MTYAFRSILTLAKFRSINTSKQIKNAKQSHKSYFKVEDTNNKAFDLSYHDPYLKFY